MPIEWDPRTFSSTSATRDRCMCTTFAFGRAVRRGESFGLDALAEGPAGMTGVLWIWCLLLFGSTYGQISNSVGYRTQFSRERNCSWIRNVEDADTLQLHQRASLESCLYLYLQDRSASGTRLSPSPLEVLPPVPYRQRVAVQVRKFVLRRVVVDESVSKATVMAALSTSWKDSRAQWDAGEWKLTELEFKSSSSIWTPDVFPSRSQNFPTLGHANTRAVIARSDGNVSCRSEIQAQSQCVPDYDQFPSDQQTCCFNLYSPSTRNSILYQYDSNSTADFTDPSTFAISPTWRLDRVNLTVELDDEPQTGSKNQLLRVCLRLRRHSPTLRIELTLPATVAALIMLLAPLSGNLRGQIVVKLFCLLLQLLCFQFLIQRTPAVGMGGSFPKIYFFYDYTIGATILNLFVSLLVYGLSQRHRPTAPSQSLATTAKRINTVLFCCDKEERIDRNPWLDVFVAASSIVNVAIAVSYLAGLAVVFLH